MRNTLELNHRRLNVETDSMSYGLFIVDKLESGHAFHYLLSSLLMNEGLLEALCEIDQEVKFGTVTEREWAQLVRLSWDLRGLEVGTEAEWANMMHGITPSLFMTQREKEELANLPDEVTLYRSDAAYSERKAGICWTLSPLGISDLPMALPSDDGIISITVSKRDIFALTLVNGVEDTNIEILIVEHDRSKPECFGVTTSALEHRVRRRLAKENETLRKTRSHAEYLEFGHYYILDQDGHVVAAHCSLGQLASELGSLKHWEHIQEAA
jgi:hypothetical protein